MELDFGRRLERLVPVSYRIHPYWFLRTEIEQEGQAPFCLWGNNDKASMDFDPKEEKALGHKDEALSYVEDLADEFYAHGKHSSDSFALLAFSRLTRPTGGSRVRVKFN